MMVSKVDVVVIGGGMAGMSVAAELSPGMDVVVVEREASFTHHSTGRSAAVYVPGLGGSAFAALAAASHDALAEPDSAFSERRFVEPCGLLTLWTAAGDDHEEEAAVATGNRRDGATERVELDDLVRRCPWVDPSIVSHAEFQADVADLDVPGLHQAYVRQAARRGVTTVKMSDVVAIESDGSAWMVKTAADAWSTAVVVNAAGAWGDLVAASAGVTPIGLVPKRRTAFTVSAPGVTPGPMIGDSTMTFYAKPEAGEQLLMSPMDQTPVPPSDVRHDEIDVAITIERGQPFIVPTLRRVRAAWAGLRVFAPDEHPVIGWGDRSGFFWLCGQGGTGIQTAPAAARCAASVIEGNGVPADIVEHGLDVDLIDPARFS